jgi:transcriptional regulator with XRE-family HTH domain
LKCLQVAGLKVKNMRCSRAAFARKLRINERTLEKWEQGRAKPNPQTTALVPQVRRYPDTLERLEKVAAVNRPSINAPHELLLRLLPLAQ